MRQLLLLRHAKSSWDDPKLPDFERPLNLRGRAAATAMREAMAGLGLSPDQVLVSTAQRTLQTLRESAQERVKLFHNPGLHDLAMLLLGTPATEGADHRRLREGYPSGALVELVVPGPWADLAEGGARLAHFLCPRDLPPAH